MNENLARIIAMLLSDGSVYFDKSKRTYCIQFTNSVPEMLGCFSGLFQSEFGARKFRINRCKNAASVRFFSKEIALVLFQYSPSYRTAVFKDGNYPNCRIPKEIFEDEALAASFLRAYASCDGCFYKNKSHPNGVIEIACHHPLLRKSLAALLAIFGIRCEISARRIRMQDKESVRLFAEKIGFLEESRVSDSTSVKFGMRKNDLLPGPCLP